MVAVVLFDLYRGMFSYAIHHVVALFIGTVFLWILCAANMEFAAYALLILPVVFFVLLLAIIFYDQSLLSIKHEVNRCGKLTNDCDDECEKSQDCNSCGSK